MKTASLTSVEIPHRIVEGKSRETQEYNVYLCVMHVITINEPARYLPIIIGCYGYIDSVSVILYEDARNNRKKIFNRYNESHTEDCRLVATNYLN